VAGEAPSFIKKLESADVFEGTPVKLECDVTGFPQPQITWYQVCFLFVFVGMFLENFGHDSQKSRL